MKRLKESLAIIVFLVSIICCLLITAEAAVPHLVNYQGRLTDTSGKPLEGAYEITFRIYDAEAAGNLLWEETYLGIVIQKGVFSVLLGSVTNLNLAFDKPYFLEIKVGTEVMSPRQRIASSGYAIMTEKAESADQAGNANAVSNIQASATPQANKLLPLDNNAKLPLSALKVYDSGWFAISAGGINYSKTHNLGTTKVLTLIYISDTSDGSGKFDVLFNSYVQPEYGTCVTALSATSITISTGSKYVYNGLTMSGVQWLVDSGYVRIIMLALE